MKTKIITLESHDDLISVRDKLSWAKTPRILLVYPKYAKVTLRLLDLKVLQRHADSLGAQLAIVTRRMNVRREAESLGIPVFKSTPSAQKDFWPVPEPRTQRSPKPPRRDLRMLREQVYIKEPAWRTSFLGRLAAFTVGVLAVLAVAGLFFPRATVLLTPESQNTSITIPVTTSPEIRTVSLSGEVPVQFLSFAIAAEKTINTESTLSVPMDKAAGMVQFTNSSADELIIPTGTVVATNTLIRFKTLQDVRLPAGSGSLVEVPIEAAIAGESGNVAVGTITIVEGLLGLSARVNNADPTRGGLNMNQTGASPTDRETLRTSLFAEMHTLALEQAHAQINSGDVLLVETLQHTETLQEEFTPPAGQPGTQLTLTLEAAYTAQFIPSQDLHALAASALAASIPPGFEAMGEMNFTPLAAPITDETGTTHFPLQVSQTVQRSVNLLQVNNLIRGREQTLAAAILQEELSLQTQPQIVMRPSWWRWLPLIPFNISVNSEP